MPAPCFPFITCYKTVWHIPLSSLYNNSIILKSLLYKMINFYQYLYIKTAYVTKHSSFKLILSQPTIFKFLTPIQDLKLKVIPVILLCQWMFNTTWKKHNQDCDCDFHFVFDTLLLSLLLYCTKWTLSLWSGWTYCWSFRFVVHNVSFYNFLMLF